nr:oxidoreductase ops5 [Quercus suber]
MAGRLLLVGVSLLGATYAQHETNTASVNRTGDAPAGPAHAINAIPTPSPLGGDAADLYNLTAWIPFGEALSPKLPQWHTNGNSHLGTKHAPHLPPFLSGPMPGGRPWGSRTAKNTNYYQNPPETGVTRHYEFTISRQKIAPDGVEVDGIVVNNAYPGPTIEANWGDYIEGESWRTAVRSLMLTADSDCPQQPPRRRNVTALAWTAPKRDPVHGRRTWRATMPNCPREKLYLPIQGRSLRDIMVPLTL